MGEKRKLTQPARATAKVGAEPLTRAKAMRVDDATFLKFAKGSAIDGMEQVARSKKTVEESPAVIKAASKLGAEKLTPAEQRQRFIEAAKEAGASEDEAEFDRALGAIVKAPAT